MENLPVDLHAAQDGEILPPEREDSRDMATCLCCGRPRPFLDEDGCGICEECLAP